MQTGVKRNTKRVGDISELRVMCDLVEAGYLVSIPFGENHRYDLIIEKDFVLSRVQVKTGRLRKGVVLFNCYSSHTHRGGAATRMYTGEVEFFGVYCPDTDCTYLLPLSEMPVQQGMLRVAPPRNGQIKGLRWARNYILGKGSQTSLIEVGTPTLVEVPASGETSPS
jgi:PD-(D/E)XK endonuclease